MRTKKTIEVPLYYQTLKIVVSDVLPKPQHGAYVLYKKNKAVLHITPDADQGLIAHEAVHVCNYIFKACFMDLDINNDEPYAYLMGWVVEQINNTIKDLEV